MPDKIKCKFCKQEFLYKNLVVGRGNSNANLMIIGEAPGAKEDLLGEPFVGRSGILLDEILLSVGIDSRCEAYISNVLKYRPPNNRKPTKEEIQSFMPWLYQQITLVDPMVVVLAGLTAIEAVLGIKNGITRIRGQWFHKDGRWFMPIFHPSYLLRNPSKAVGKPFQLTRQDCLLVRKKLDEYNRVPLYKAR